MTTNEETSEEGLRSRYPQLAKKGGASQLLQKRLCKGHKYFDSGDYNVARAQNQKAASVLPTQKEELSLFDTTGDTIATPETVPAVRKKSLKNPLAATNTTSILCPILSPGGASDKDAVVRDPESVETN